MSNGQILNWFSKLAPAMPVIGPALGVAGSIGSQMIQNRMNRKMSDYAYSRDLAMWEKTNQYNTTAMQMRRYGEAGLNPNLVYSQGNPGNAPASMPKYTPPQRTMQIPDLVQVLSQFQNFVIETKKLDILKEQVEQAKIGTQNASLNNALLNLKVNTNDPLAFKEANKDWGFTGAKSLTEYQFEAKKLANAKTVTQTNKILAEIGLTGSKADWAKLKYDTMTLADVNIDHDAIWMRILADFFGEKVNQYKNQFKNFIK